MRTLAIGLGCLIAVISSIFHLPAASAIEIGCPSQVGNCSPTVLWISGEIVRGDLRRLADALLGGHGEISTIILFNMRGGDLNEAIKIGRLIHRLRIRTSVGYPIFGQGGSLVSEFSNRVYYPFAARNDAPFPVPALSQDLSLCVSACIAVWAGGYDRFGAAFLFAHRISIRPGEGATADRLATRYENAQERLAEYFSEMNVSPQFIGHLNSLNNKELELVSPAALNSFFGRRDVLDEAKMLWGCGSDFPAWSDVANLQPAPEIVAKLAACQAAYTAADRLAAWKIVFHAAHSGWPPY